MPLSDEITETQSLAVRKVAGQRLRSSKLPADIRSLQPHTLTWSALGKAQRDLSKTAREIVDGMAGSDVADHERAYEGISSALDAIDHERDVRTELGSKEPRACEDVPDPRRPINHGNLVRVSMSEEHGGGTDPLESRSLRADQRVRDRVDSDPELRGVTLGRYLSAMVTGARSDAEQRALAVGSDSTGGFTSPEVLSAELIDLLRARTILNRSGARTVMLESDVQHIAKVASDPTPSWRLENAEAAESDPTFTRISFEPKSLMVVVPVSRELLQDSLNVESALPRILADAMSLELDRALLYGDGTNNQPNGVEGAITNSIAHDAALTSYAPLMQARGVVRNNNADVSAFAMHARDENALASLTDSTGQPLQAPGALSQVSMLTSTAVPNDRGTNSDESIIIGGDWSQVFVGLRSEVRIEVLRERFATQHQFGFVAHLRADVAVAQPQALVKIEGVLPS